MFVRALRRATGSFSPPLKGFLTRFGIFFHYVFHRSSVARQRYPIAPFHTGKTHAVALATALKHSLQSNTLAEQLLQGATLICI